MKPLIGILPLVDTEKDSYWMFPGYMKGIENAGGIPVMLPLTSDKSIIHQLATQIDGFLFSGGHDIDPKLYHEEMLPECTELSPERDSMEALLFEEVLRLDKPVFGICRGLQFINVALGGSLYQDLATQYPLKADHRMKPPYNRAIHKVNILPNTPFSDIIPCTELGVNSCHHQAIKELAPCLKTGAISEDGLIEAVYMPDRKFVMATQWHPEFALNADMYSEVFFAKFVEACQK